MKMKELAWKNNKGIQRLSGEYNSTSKTCMEHLGELYYRSLKSSKPIIIPRS
jgi:hypothetical protein